MAELTKRLQQRVRAPAPTKLVPVRAFRSRELSVDFVPAGRPVLLLGCCHVRRSTAALFVRLIPTGEFGTSLGGLFGCMTLSMNCSGYFLPFVTWHLLVNRALLTSALVGFDQVEPIESVSHGSRIAVDAVEIAQD